MFSVVLLGTHLPAVYGLTLRDEWVHICEHALYLFCAVLIWAPLLGVDPLPGRLRRPARRPAWRPAWSRWRSSASGCWSPARRSTPTTATRSARPARCTTSEPPVLIMLLAGVPAFAVVPLARLARLIPAPGLRPWAVEPDQLVA